MRGGIFRVDSKPPPIFTGFRVPQRPIAVRAHFHSLRIVDTLLVFLRSLAKQKDFKQGGGAKTKEKPKTHKSPYRLT